VARFMQEVVAGLLRDTRSGGGPGTPIRGEGAGRGLKLIDPAEWVVSPGVSQAMGYPKTRQVSHGWIARLRLHT